MARGMARRVRRGPGLGPCLLVAVLAWGTMPSLAQQPVSQPPVEERPDVRVIIDVSGSMKDNDPDRLSTSALELLVSLLPGGVSAGVWTFGERVENPLPLGEVNAAWRERALALPPELVNYQQFTDIESAIREAAAPEANGWRHLVLLTDGMIDLPPSRGAKPAIDMASRDVLVDELARSLADQGVAVHGIAFSDQADLSLVERLSQVTGGLSSTAENPESLLGAFLDIVERIFPDDQVPLEEGRFVIDPGVESFSALLFHEPGGEPLRLIAPDGSVYLADDHPEGIRWQVEPRFDVIRVPDPVPGEWRLEGVLGEDSRVSVISPLTLRTRDLPATLYLGFPVPIEAWVEEEGEPLAEGLDDLSISVELRDMQGEIQASLQLSEDNGRFVGELPAPALTGNARLIIRAEGEGFHRQRPQAVNILPAIGALHDPDAGRVELAAEHPFLDTANTDIWGELAGEVIQAEAISSRRWYLPLPELDASVSQPLMLNARIQRDGETREVRLPRLILNPEAETRLDQADMAGPTLGGERLQDAPDREDASPSAGMEAADRFVAMVNAIPRRAMELWEEKRPGLARLAQTYGRDPLVWAIGAFCLLLVVVWLFIRRLRRPRRITHREEPHV